MNEFLKNFCHRKWHKTAELQSLAPSCSPVTTLAEAPGIQGRSAAHTYFICHHPTAGASQAAGDRWGTTVTAPNSPAIVATIPTVHRACRSSRQGKAHSPAVPSPCRATLPDTQMAVADTGMSCFCMAIGYF